MKKVWLLISTFFIILKKVYLWADSFIILMGIDAIIKLVEYNLIYTKLVFPFNFILMFIYSLILRRILILIYDIRRKDDFTFEKIKEKNNEIKNKMTEKIKKYKSFGNFALFIFFNFYQPIFVIIYYREGTNKWNGIPNLRILLYFIISIFSCNLILFVSFTGINKVIELIIKNIF